ncbi:MAG: TonB-dependent receptor, partial [Bacteroidota bacterium]
AYGGEVLFTRKTPKWTGWLSYTYARTFVTVEENEINKESINDGERFPANYDQPHSIRFTSDLKWGRRGSFGASFTYNTGRPITVIESDYLLDELLAPNFSDRNKFRIPDYWRLDVSFTMGSILRKFDDKLVFSVYNVFGRDNAYSVFFRRPDNINVPRPFKLAVLGAIFPSLTYSINLPRGN